MEGDMDFKAKTTSSLKNMSRMFGEFFTEVGSTMSAMETDLVNIYSDFVEGVIPLFLSRPNTDWHEDLPSELLTDDESLIDTPSTQKLEISSFSAEGVTYGNSEEEDRSETEHEEDEDRSKADDEGEVDSSEEVEGEFSSEGEDDEDSNEGEVEGEREYSSEDEDEDSSEDEDEDSSEDEDEDSSEEEDEDSSEEEDEDSSEEGDEYSIEEEDEYSSEEEDEDSSEEGEEEECSEQDEEYYSNEGEDDYSIEGDLKIYDDDNIEGESDYYGLCFDGYSTEEDTDDDSSCPIDSLVNACFEGQSDDNSEGEEPEGDCASDLDIEEMEKAILEMIRDVCASDLDIEKWKKAFEEKLEDARASDLNIEELIEEFQKEFQEELKESPNNRETMETTLGNQFQTARTPFYDFFSGYVGCAKGLIPVIPNPISRITLDSSRHEKFPYEATIIDELFINMHLEQRCDTNLVPRATNDELEVKMPLEEKNLSPEITPKPNKEEDADQCHSPNSVIKVKGLEDLISCAEGVHSVSSVAVHFDGESMRSRYYYPDADYGRSDDDSSEADAEDDCVAEETFEKEVDEELVSKIALYQEYETETLVVVDTLIPADQEEVRLSDYHGFSGSEWEILSEAAEEEVDDYEVRKRGKLEIPDSDWEIV